MNIWFSIKMIVQNLRQSLIIYLSGILIYGLAMVIYAVNPYYQTFISHKPVDISFFSIDVQYWLSWLFTIVGWNTWEVLVNLFFAYAIVSLFICIVSKTDGSQDRSYILIRGIISVCKQIPRYLSNLGKDITVKIDISQEERVTALFFLVKLFYLPVMLNFAFGNFELVIQDIRNISSGDMTNEQWIRCIYFTLFNLVFLVDTIFFTFGYMFEAKFLKNKVKSVEPTLLGWLVTLACYPPLIQMTILYLPWGSSDYSDFGNVYLTMVMAVIALGCAAIYLWATLSLGTRCSNLTNRGIVSTGAYGIVRHPAYASKNLLWFVMAIPIIGFNLWNLTAINWLALLSVVGWMIIYFLRAITEEHHLMQDPDYREYCNKVRYRFIPGII